MISGRDIIIISSIDWSFLWQVHQEIALRFARAGNRVIYIENTGVRAPRLSDVRRIAVRLKNWGRALRSEGLGQVAANVHLISPLMFPPFSLGARLANRFLFSALVKRALKRLDVRHPILWTYLPTDTALTLIEELQTPDALLIYYCVADFSQLTPLVHREELRDAEQRLLKLSDLVFTNGSQIAERFRPWTKDVYVFPPGVDFTKFAITENDETQSNGHYDSTPVGKNGLSLNSMPRPVIGYVGGLHRFVDLDLLINIVRTRPEWSWVFVGPVHTKLGSLPKLPNVFLLGQKPHDELAPLIRNFDVCLVPYLVNSSTVTIAPVKINEYLAVGKPVVSTELPAVCEFNQLHHVLITAANNSESFLEAIDKALRLPKDKHTVTRRLEVAALSDWQNRFEAMNELIEKKIHTSQS